VAYSAPAECKNWGLTGNLKRIIGSFLGNKRIGDVSSIIYQGLHLLLTKSSNIISFPHQVFLWLLYLVN